MSAVKELAPYLIALVVLIGGAAMLFLVPSDRGLDPFITTTIGSVLAWVYTNRTQQQTAQTTAENIFTQPPSNGGTNGGTNATTGPTTGPAAQ